MTISVKPLRLGELDIAVHDQGLENSEPVHCRVSIVQPHRIRISAPTSFMEINSETRVQVVVTDMENRQFHSSQYEFMNIRLTLDSESDYFRSRAFKFIKEQGGQTFRVQSTLVGDHRIYAELTLPTGSTITSDRIEINVYEPLRAYPPVLHMTVGCQTTLKLVGGPSHSSRRSHDLQLHKGDINNTMIQIDEHSTGDIFLVSAKYYGQIDVVFAIKAADSDVVLSSTTVRMFVKHISSIDIAGMSNRRVHTGTTLRFVPSIRVQSGIMSPASCSLLFYWHTHQANLLQIHYHSNQDMLLPTFDTTNIGVNATALHAGELVVELRVKMNCSVGCWNATEYYTSAKLTIVDPADIPIPTYIGQANTHSAHLIIPPQSEYRIPTSKDTSRVLIY
jgi:hypothetical protein